MSNPLYVLKLEYKPVTAGGPCVYVFTDESGNETIDDIADKVTAAFQKLEDTILYFTENCDCTQGHGGN